MTTTPTPEEFLALNDPEDDTDEVTPTGVRSWPPPGFDRAFVLPPDPLQSIAESLRILAAAALADPHQQTQAESEAQERYDRLDQEYADLEDKHRSLYELLAEVEKIVKPSTSKLANTVREAITRWRNPEVPATPEPAPAEGPTPGEPEKIWETPAHDAAIEVWREYAVACGHAEANVDSMNRSQIRTLLGIPHGDQA